MGQGQSPETKPPLAVHDLPMRNSGHGISVVSTFTLPASQVDGQGPDDLRQSLDSLSIERQRRFQSGEPTDQLRFEDVFVRWITHDVMGPHFPKTIGRSDDQIRVHMPSPLWRSITIVSSMPIVTRVKPSQPGRRVIA